MSDGTSPCPHPDPCTCRGALQPGSRPAPSPRPGLPFWAVPGSCGRGVWAAPPWPRDGFEIRAHQYFGPFYYWVVVPCRPVDLTRGHCGWGPGIQEENWAEKRPQVTAGVRSPRLLPDLKPRVQPSWPKGLRREAPASSISRDGGGCPGAGVRAEGPSAPGPEPPGSALPRPRGPSLAWDSPAGRKCTAVPALGPRGPAHSVPPPLSRVSAWAWAWPRHLLPHAVPCADGLLRKEWPLVLYDGSAGDLRSVGHRPPRQWLQGARGPGPPADGLAVSATSGCGLTGPRQSHCVQPREGDTALFPGPEQESERRRSKCWGRGRGRRRIRGRRRSWGRGRGREWGEMCTPSAHRARPLGSRRPGPAGALTQGGWEVTRGRQFLLLKGLGGLQGRRVRGSGSLRSVTVCRRLRGGSCCPIQPSSTSQCPWSQRLRGGIWGPSPSVRGGVAGRERGGEGGRPASVYLHSNRCSAHAGIYSPDLVRSALPSSFPSQELPAAPPPAAG